MDKRPIELSSPAVVVLCWLGALVLVATSCATATLCPECDDADAAPPSDLCTDPALPDQCGFEPTEFCTDLATDRNNCGLCGTVCGTEQQCSGGQCTCPGDLQIG